MVASMVFDVEHFGDPDKDTMHWAEIRGLFPFRFTVRDVRWLRAAEHCPPGAPLGQGGENRCIVALAPSIAVEMEPQRYIFGGRMVVDKLRIPQLFVSKAAFFGNETQVEKSPDPSIPRMLQATRLVGGTAGLRRTQPTPDWMHLSATTLLEFYDLTRVSFVDDTTIAELAVDAWKGRTIAPRGGFNIGNTVIDRDITVYGKSTIVGDKGDWKLTGHAYLVDIDGTPDERAKEHLEIKLEGNAAQQVVSFASKWRLVINGSLVQGTATGKGGWRALNMALVPYESLEGTIDFDLELELPNATVSVKAHVDEHRVVSARSIAVTDKFSDMQMLGHGKLGSLDLKRHWPQKMNIVVSKDTKRAQLRITPRAINTILDNGDAHAVLRTVFNRNAIHSTMRSAHAMGHTMPFERLELIITPPVPLGDHPGNIVCATALLNLYKGLDLQKEWGAKAQTKLGELVATFVPSTGEIRHLDGSLASDGETEAVDYGVTYGSVQLSGDMNRVNLEMHNVATTRAFFDSVTIMVAPETQGDKVRLEDWMMPHWGFDIKGNVSEQLFSFVGHGNASYDALGTTLVVARATFATDTAEVQWGPGDTAFVYDAEKQFSVSSFARFGLVGQDPTGQLTVAGEVDCTKTLGPSAIKGYSFNIEQQIGMLYSLVPLDTLAMLPNHTSVGGVLKMDAVGGAGALPEIEASIENGQITTPNQRLERIQGTFSLPSGEYNIDAEYHAKGDPAFFNSNGVFVWRRRALRLCSENYWEGDNQVEIAGDIVWKPATKTGILQRLQRTLGE